jgi:hypothetical protein
MLRGTGVAGTAAITGGNTWFLQASSYSAVSAPADTTEDTLATIAVPVLSANAVARLRANFSFTSSANNKTIRARFSGGAGSIVYTQTFTTQTPFSLVLIIANRNATNSQFIEGLGSFGSNINETATTATIDTTAATSIVLTGQKATGSETLTLEGYTLEIYKP